MATAVRTHGTQSLPVSPTMNSPQTAQNSDDTPRITNNTTIIVESHQSLSASASLYLDKQQKAMEALESKYRLEHVQKHQWKWTTYSEKRSNEWVPAYTLAKKLSIEEIYAEYAVGWQGCFSIKMLQDIWEANGSLVIRLRSQKQLDKPSSTTLLKL